MSVFRVSAAGMVERRAPAVPVRRIDSAANQPLRIAQPQTGTGGDFESEFTRF